MINIPFYLNKIKIEEEKYEQQISVVVPLFFFFSKGTKESEKVN